ncbi:MAG: hypothetical protein KAQ79_11620 [Cyclobacteriaceae bacterium]|nr:hypothetical protein [Cyclobacteriaceae bacterium]
MEKVPDKNEGVVLMCIVGAAQWGATQRKKIPYRCGSMGLNGPYVVSLRKHT